MKQHAGVGLGFPLRARDAAKARRAAAAPPPGVRVVHLTPVSAARAGRFDIPTHWSEFTLVLRVSSVLADRSSPEAGLLLSDIPVLVCGRQEHGDRSLLVGTTVTVTAWGADSTMRAMTQDDWRFAVEAAVDAPVPAFVSSHLRALAYYSALPVSVEVLRRWKAAQEQVLEQVELLESVFGSGTPASERDVVDMTGEQVMSLRDRGVSAAWCAQARTIATSSQKAYARASHSWLRQQGSTPEQTLIATPTGGGSDA